MTTTSPITMRTTRTPSRALVIGGSTGIGLGLAEGFAQADTEVHVVSRSRPATDIATLNWHVCDLTDRSRTQATLEDLTRDPLDIVCFAAVYYGDRRAPLVDTSLADWQRQVDIMVHGLWLTWRITLPALISAQPGVFLSVSSEVVLNAGPDRAGYTAVKSAAHGLARSAAQEYGPDQLRVVETMPQGMVDSPGIRRRRPADFDYSGYMTPKNFRPLARYLAETRGEAVAGRTLVVHPSSDWSVLDADERPPSQSDRGGHERS